MHLRFLLIPLIVLLSMAVSGFGAPSKKAPKLTIRFHLQASEADGPAFTMRVPAGSSGLPAFVKKIPEINEQDIVSVYPFAAADGSLGCSFALSPHGRIMLDTVSVENRGRVFVILVNGRVVTAMLIDRRVSDGIVSIPAGLTPAEIDLIKQEYPMMGETPTKKKRRR